MNTDSFLPTHTQHAGGAWRACRQYGEGWADLNIRSSQACDGEGVRLMPMYTPITEQAISDIEQAQDYVLRGQAERALPLLDRHMSRLLAWDQWRKDLKWELDHGQSRTKQTA